MSGRIQPTAATGPSPRPRYGDPGVAPSIRRLARTLDSKFRLPILGWRFGLDGLIGLVPVIGDLLSALYGAVVVLEAFRLRVPLPVMSRMLWNLGVDAALGSVPVVGDAMDFIYKPNERNLKLLVSSVERRRRLAA